MGTHDQVAATRTTRYLLGTNPNQGYDGERRRPFGLAPVGRHFMPRLSWLVTPKLHYDPGDVARGLSGGLKDAVVFVDTSMFDTNTDQRIWDALLAREDGFVLIPSVRRELEPWLARHESLPAARAVLDNHRSIAGLDLSGVSADERRAYSYYTNLLSLRKLLSRLQQAGGSSDHVLSKTTDPKQFWDLLHQLFGPRGHLLAKKGAASIGSPNFHTDEEVVFWAVYLGITAGRDVAILTKDEDLQEQFYKLLSLMNTHYRGMLLADIYAGNPGGFVAHPMPTDGQFGDAFEAGGLLVERSEDFIARNLPLRYKPIILYCFILGQQLTQMTFCADHEMSRLLEVKGATGGLNTDRLDGRNCHLWLAPMNVPKSLRGCAAVARDRSIRLQSEEVNLPVLDMNQAACSVERFAHYSGEERVRGESSEGS